MKYLIPIVFLISLSELVMAQPASIRPLSELVIPKESAWPLIISLKDSAKNKVEILPRTKAKAETALREAQITTKSPLGAVIYETGGILVDSGWIRILGSGSPRLGRSLTDWNKDKGLKAGEEKTSFVLVADDVLGGFFALNRGGLSDTNLNKIFYFSPDNAQWEDLEMSYTQFLHFIFNDDLDDFYEGLRWKGWRKEVYLMDGNRGIMCYPYLFTKEGADIEKVTRSQTTIQELWDFHFHNK